MTWPNSDIQAKIPEIRDYLGEVWWSYSENMVDKVFFIPLRDVYFFDESQSITGNINQGDSQLVRILLAACIILMLFAVLNYINLTVAQSGRRAKEMPRQGDGHPPAARREQGRGDMEDDSGGYRICSSIDGAGGADSRGPGALRLAAAGI